MWYLAPEEIFENMLHLKRFGLNFERILNRKWLLSNTNSDISSGENLKLTDAIWCVLMYYFDQN